MDIARLTSKLDTTLADLQTLHTQVDTALQGLPKTADASYRAQIEDLRNKLSRTRAAATQAREAARGLAPKTYQTETAGL